MFAGRRYLALVLTLISAISFSASALSPQRICELATYGKPGLSMNNIRRASAERARKRYAQTPAPGFDFIEEQVNVEQVGESGPLALNEFLGPYSFLSTPAPTSADPVAVDLVEEGVSFPVHLDLPWKGQRTSTAVYASLPRARSENPGNYLIGKENPVVVISLHGGGTPTATGRNGMSIGKNLSKRGIPVIGMDLPGHGRATRKIRGLETFEGQIAWLMEAIKKLVHPDVKIVLAGHSWGGEFVLKMNRLSADPRFAQIARYISMAPPVDVSLGTSNRAKLDFGNYFEKNFDRYEPLIAPSDFEFQKNMLNNGKNSDVGSYFTAFTDLDYLTRVLTPEEQAKLKPLTVIVGEADGLVYVGREDKFAALFGGLTGESSFVLLPAGRTWKSKGGELLATGHNIFDRYKDGTTTLEVYEMLGDLAIGAGQRIVSEPPRDEASNLIERTFRNYANFFGFRELVENRVEFVRVETAQRKENVRRKEELQAYLATVDGYEKELERIREGKASLPGVVEAMEEYRIRFGLAEKIPLRRAIEELSYPELTPERAALLRAYLKRADEAEAAAKASYRDPDYEVAIEALLASSAKIMEELGIRDLVAEYPGKLKEYQELKKLDSKQTKIRGELSKIHQKYTEIAKAKSARFGRARDLAVAAVPTPEGVTDYRSAMRELSPDRPDRDRLALYVAALRAYEDEVKVRVVGGLTEKISQQPRPEGVTGISDARGKLEEIESVLAMTWAPAGDEELASAAERVRTLGEDLDALTDGDAETKSLASLGEELKARRKERSDILKKFEGMWRQNLISSSALAAREAEVAKLLSSYKEIYLTYEIKKGDWLLSLKESGKWNEESILASTPELRALRTEVFELKKAFFAARATLENLRWSAAMNGKLEGAEEAVAEARAVAVRAWGTGEIGVGEASKADPESAIGKWLKAEEDFDQREALVDSITQVYEEARVHYNQLLEERGLPVMTQITPVRIYDMLNMSLAQLRSNLSSNPTSILAFRQMLAAWDSFLARFRSESHHRDGNNGGAGADIN